MNLDRESDAEYAERYRWLCENARFVEIHTHTQLFRCRGDELDRVLEVASRRDDISRRS